MDNNSYIIDFSKAKESIKKKEEGLRLENLEKRKEITDSFKSGMDRAEKSALFLRHGLCAELSFRFWTY